MDETEEQTRYDRQIRLWGHTAQQRMRECRVMVVNLGGLAVEVVKNLVLAGIGVVHIYDDHNATVSDLAVNFFLREADLGAPRAQAAQARIQELNPLVEVVCEAKGLAALPDTVLQQYDVVCLTECSRAEELRVDCLMRAAGKAFLSCHSHGLLVSVFLDFGEHFKYSEKTAGGDTEERTVDFSSLEEVLGSTQWRKCRPSRPFLACQVLRESKEQGADLLATRDALASRHGFDAATLPAEYLHDLPARGRGEISAVCTVVGGVVAQEVLKAAQRTAAPLCNFFVYDALDCDLKGLVERLP